MTNSNWELLNGACFGEITEQEKKQEWSIPACVRYGYNAESTDIEQLEMEIAISKSKSRRNRNENRIRRQGFKYVVAISLIVCALISLIEYAL